MVQSVIWEEGEDESRKKQWPCAKGGGGGSKQKEEILLQSTPAPAPTQQYSGTQYRGKRRKVDICGIVLLPPISVSNQHTVQLSWGKYKYKYNQVQVQHTVQTAQLWQVQAQVQ